MTSKNQRLDKKRQSRSKKQWQKVYKHSEIPFIKLLRSLGVKAESVKEVKHIEG